MSFEPRYDYGEDTLRGALARVVLARADELVREYSPTSVEVSIEEVAEVFETEAPAMYERLMEVLDPYFDDWAHAVAEARGVEI